MWRAWCLCFFTFFTFCPRNVFLSDWRGVVPGGKLNRDLCTCLLFFFPWPPAVIATPCLLLWGSSAISRDEKKKVPHVFWPQWKTFQRQICKCLVVPFLAIPWEEPSTGDYPDRPASHSEAVFRKRECKLDPSRVSLHCYLVTTWSLCDDWWHDTVYLCMHQSKHVRGWRA